MKQPVVHSWLIENIAYCQETGVFTWKKNHFRSLIGKVAGRKTKDGYWAVYLHGHPFLAHRVVHFFVFGTWPDGPIDHINGDRCDNRFCNLRVVNSFINSENMRSPHRDSETGVLGISRHGKSGFQAKIQVSGKSVSLGTHKTMELAHAAYLTAKRQLHEGCTL